MILGPLHNLLCTIGADRKLCLPMTRNDAHVWFGRKVDTLIESMIFGRMDIRAISFIGIFCILIENAEPGQVDR